MDETQAYLVTELIVGRIYFMRYHGICDDCGVDIVHPWLPVQYQGRGEDGSGMGYRLFEACFYVLCPRCKKFMQYIRKFDSLDASKVPLFGEAGGRG